MKSQHRHELETNYLSAALARWIEKIKPFTGQIITGVVLLAILYVGLTLWEVQSAVRERAAWDAFALATDSRDPEMKSLQRVAGAEEHDGTAMQEWAYVGWADRQVLNAMNTYFYDRERTKDLLNSASGIYKTYASGAGDPQVLNRARFGLARVYELQNKIDEARQHYLTVRGELQPQASVRAKRLESTAVREACDWLATADLPKRDVTGGQGATGARPEFDAIVPSGTPAKDGITAKSLEELLGDFGNEAPQENRYGEEDEPDTTDTESESPAETETSAESAAGDNDSAPE